MAEQSTAKKSDAKQPGASTAPNWRLIGTILLVAWSCLRFPRTVLSPDLDASWTAVLFHAREHGLQFGRDIVWTYGPLGFLSTEWFLPYMTAARIVFELAVGFGIATGLCLLAWRMPLWWRALVLGFFVVISVSVSWGGDAMNLDLGVVAWGLLCFLETGPRLRIYALALVLLAATGALVKFTFLLMGLFTIGLLACDLVLRRRRALAAAMVIGFMLAFTLGWLLLGQNLSGIPAYLSTSRGVASGYSATMGLRFINPFWPLLMTIAAAAAVASRASALWWRRGALLLWLAGLLFVEWKYAAVRSDWGHVALTLCMTPIVALCMEAMPGVGKRAVFGSRAAGLLCAGIAFLFVQGQTVGFALTGCAGQTAHNMAASAGILARPARYSREKMEEFQAEQKREQLPKIRALAGNATVDVFGQNQTIAILNELNYHPRPVFQSYAAYTRAMMELNEQFYLSPGAPEFVVFNLVPIDKRFPALADALVLRQLLVNYEFVANDWRYLLLRRKGTAKVQSTLLKEGTMRVGEKISLSAYGDAMLWLEIELQPTTYGGLQQFAYQPADTQLTIWGPGDAAKRATFHAPAAMLSAGFLINPLLLDNSDVMSFFSGNRRRSADAFSVNTEATIMDAWHPEIHFRLYRVGK